MTASIYKVEFTHYAPKNSEEGIKTLLAAKDDLQVMRWIWRECMFGPSDSTLNAETEVCPSNKWWVEHPEERQRALDLGLEVDDDMRYVTGPYRDVMLWWRCDPTGPTELRYGHTTWGWERLGPATKANVAALTSLGLLEDASKKQGIA